MIRAVIREGKICPLDPLPEAWTEGEVLEIEHSSVAQENVEQWLNEMNDLTAELDDPEDWRRLEECLAEQRRRSKEHVRRQMGLEQ